MLVKFDDKFKLICKEIVEEDFREDEWEKRSYSDYFYEMPFCGGYEKEINAFIFGYYTEDGILYSFQLKLDQIPKVLSGEITEVEAIKEY